MKESAFLQYSEDDIRACILILIMGDLEQVRTAKIAAIENGVDPAKIKGHTFVAISKLFKVPNATITGVLSTEYHRLIDEQDALVGNEDVLNALQAELASIIYEELLQRANRLKG